MTLQALPTPSYCPEGRYSLVLLLAVGEVSSADLEDSSDSSVCVTLEEMLRDLHCHEMRM